MCSRNRLDRPVRNRVVGASLAATAAMPLLLLHHASHSSISDTVLGCLMGAQIGVGVALMLRGSWLCRLRGRM